MNDVTSLGFRTLGGSDVLSHSNQVSIRHTLCPTKSILNGLTSLQLCFYYCCILHEHYKAYHIVICLHKLFS